MRCPKCGYISFDHLEKCLKCNKDIKATASSLFGSTYNIQAPTFLKLPPQQQEESLEESDLFQEHSVDEVDEYVDEELEILVEDEDADLEGEIRFAQDDETGLGLAEKDEAEDDGEIEIDFSQFEDADESEVNLLDEDMTEEELAEPIAKAAPVMDIPAELSDMSDLAPPGKETARQPAEKRENADLSDLELEDLYIDLGLDGVDEEQKNKKATAKDTILALDEIDFSDSLGGSGSGTSRKSGNMDMDEDLDFDLDLGGLSIHKDV